MSSQPTVANTKYDIKSVFDFRLQFCWSVVTSKNLISFLRKMSPRLTIEMALFLLVLALDVSYGGTFCDKGPEGIYCFEDLSGYYNCTFDEQAQKMTEKEHNCPFRTRWVCNVLLRILFTRWIGLVQWRKHSLSSNVVKVWFRVSRLFMEVDFFYSLPWSDRCYYNSLSPKTL